MIFLLLYLPRNHLDITRRSNIHLCSDSQNPGYPEISLAVAAKVLMSVRSSIVGAAQSSEEGELRNAEEREKETALTDHNESMNAQ